MGFQILVQKFRVWRDDGSLKRLQFAMYHAGKTNKAVDLWEEAMLGRIRNPLTRRTVLASGAAMIAAPAHAKGPKVWMDLDQVELDAAYDQNFYAPLWHRTQARRAANSELARKRLGAPQREAYGPTDVEKLDIFKAKKPNAPIFVFIHGG